MKNMKVSPPRQEAEENERWAVELAVRADKQEQPEALLRETVTRMGTENQERVQRVFAEAAKRLLAADKGEAAEELLAVFNEASWLPPLTGAVLRLHVRQGRHEDAKGLYGRLRCRQGSDNPTILYYVSAAYVALAQGDELRQLWRDVLRQRGPAERGELLHDACYFLRRGGMDTLADDLYEILLEVSPKEPRVYCAWLQYKIKSDGSDEHVLASVRRAVGECGPQKVLTDLILNLCRRYLEQDNAEQAAALSRVMLQKDNAVRVMRLVYELGEKGHAQIANALRGEVLAVDPSCRVDVEANRRENRRIKESKNRSRRGQLQAEIAKVGADVDAGRLSNALVQLQQLISKHHTLEQIPGLFEVFARCAARNPNIMTNVFIPFLQACVRLGKLTEDQAGQHLDAAQALVESTRMKLEDAEAERVMHVVRSRAMRAIIDQEVPTTIQGVNATAMRVLKNAPIPPPDFPTVKRKK